MLALKCHIGNDQYQFLHVAFLHPVLDTSRLNRSFLINPFYVYMHIIYDSEAKSLVTSMMYVSEGYNHNCRHAGFIVELPTHRW